MYALDDIIAAIATAPGVAGLAVVRVSGAGALTLCDRVFRGRVPLADAVSHTLHHGWAVDLRIETDCIREGVEQTPARAGEPSGSRGLPKIACGREVLPVEPSRRLDEVVAAIFRAPHSYTREDVVELSCHGGTLCAGRVLAALLGTGARLARPGEFTLRAFLNGRLDLAQAEAVADLIHAESEAAHALALAQLAGELSRRLETLTEGLSDAAAEIEARVDFAEDVGGIEVPAPVVTSIEAAAAELERMLGGALWARAVREGVSVPIVGRPNAGKSSLFNALVGEARAIVTAFPGTTRDRVSETIEIAGVRVTLSDTAGLREPADEVERIGVERSRVALEQATLAVWVVDGASPLGEADRAIAVRLAGRRLVVALNKCDRGAALEVAELEPLLDGAAREFVSVSATRGDGIEALRDAIARLLGASAARAPAGEGGLCGAIGNLRHAESLARARQALKRAARAARDGEPGEIVALELRESLFAIGEVTGRSVGEDLLERIFSRFCIGK